MEVIWQFIKDNAAAVGAAAAAVAVLLTVLRGVLSAAGRGMVRIFKLLKGGESDRPANSEEPQAQPAEAKEPNPQPAFRMARRTRCPQTQGPLRGQSPSVFWSCRSMSSGTRECPPIKPSRHSLGSHTYTIVRKAAALIAENAPSSPDTRSQTATPPQPAETLGFSENQTATKDRVVAVGKSPKPTESATCGGVAVWNGEPGDARVIEADTAPSAPEPDDDGIEREPVGRSHERLKI